MFFTKKKEEKYKNEIATLKHEIADLRQTIVTQELIRLRSENLRLKEKEELLNKIKFRLKDVAYVEEDDAVLVKYSFPSVKVFFNEDGGPKRNELFYSINKLQLIPFNDMSKIQAVLDEVKLMKSKK